MFACAAILSAALLTALQGCGRSVSSIVGPNEPPVLEIVSARADRQGLQSVRVRWEGRDPDGRIASYCWTLAPLGARGRAGETNSTAGNELMLTRPSPVSVSGQGSSRPEPDLFTLWALDDAGAESAPVDLALFASNVAPSVTIVNPDPRYSQFGRDVTPNFCIAWSGNDPDGVFTQKPVKYKFTLLTDTTPITINAALALPDTIRRYYAPIAWAGWDSTSSDTTFASFTGLTPFQNYLFVVTAFDEAGDYDPVFSLTKNMLHFSVRLAEVNGPRITLWGDNFHYDYQSGGWFDIPARAVNVEVPSATPLTFSWSAEPPPGNAIRSYRWVLDPLDLRDGTPRTDEVTDTGHWSQPSPNVTSVTLGPFTRPNFKREEHKLYIEARSIPGGCGVPGNEFVSLGIVHFVVVRPTANNSLLIVDDTRLQPDRFSAPGCPNNYSGLWPSAAELDTFLYARGGVPWQCTKNPTSGVISTPGLFAGYDFDTLGTRGLLSGLLQAQGPGGFPSQNHTVPLSVLAEYRHVIWITDGVSAQSSGAPQDPLNPMPALRHMSQPGQVSVLSTYVGMGGKLWLVGGGPLAAMLLPWDRVTNNSGGITRFSSASPYFEIGPGRMPWENLHLRSEVSLNQASIATRSLGRFASAPGPYASLPTALQSKTVGTDPLPPTRLASQGSTFYVPNHRVEYLSQPNAIVEDVNPDPDIYDAESTLDTLFAVTGSLIPNSGLTTAAMTLYHGPENAQVVWSGFDIWTYRRSQCIALVDWVLQDLWGLSRAAVPRGPAAAPAASTRDAGPPRPWARLIRPGTPQPPR